MTGVPWSALLSAALAGLLGGAHCLTMCGGFAAACAAREQPRGAAPLLPRRVLMQRQAMYHAGRITTYALLGAFFGLAGQAAFAAAYVLSWERPLYVVANIALLLVALGMVLGNRRGFLQRLGGRAFGQLIAVIGGWMRGGGWRSRAALGLAWGLVPCALIYGLLPVAMFAGGAWQGALVMVLFGLGTVANFAGGTWMLARVRTRDAAMLPHAAALLIASFAVVGLMRVLVLDDLASGPFCLLR